MFYAASVHGHRVLGENQILREEGRPCFGGALPDLVSHPQGRGHARLGQGGDRLGARVLYLAFGLDTGFFPVVGYTDDFAAILAAISAVTMHVKPIHREKAAATVARIFGPEDRS